MSIFGKCKEKVSSVLERHRSLVMNAMAVLLAIAMVLSGVQVTIERVGNGQNSSILLIGGNEVVITIGTAEAATVTDYTCNGLNDSSTFQTALNALPSGGGKLEVLGGNYVFTATVNRTINNVTIEGVGKATYFAYNASSAIFSAGSQSNWVFKDFSTDAGGVNVASAVSYRLDNIYIGTTFYPPSVRVATTVVAAYDAPTYWKSQADVICDGTADEVQINAAIAKGGTVQLSSGTFKTNAQVSVNVTNVTLAGVGWDTVIVPQVAMLWSVATLSGTHLTVRDMTINGNLSANCTYFGGGPNNSYINLYIYGHTTNEIGGVPNVSVIDRCQIIGKPVIGNANGITFSNNYFNGDGTSQCLQVPSGTAVSIIHNVFESYYDYAVSLGCTTVDMTGNYFESDYTTNEVLYITSITSGSIKGNYQTATSNTTYFANVVASRNLVMTGNYNYDDISVGSGVEGIEVDAASVGSITYGTKTGLRYLKLVYPYKDNTIAGWDTQSFQNLLLNGSFEKGNPPSSWSFNDAGTSGNYGRTDTKAKIGSYATNVTSSDAYCYMYQATSGNVTYFQSRTFTFGAWVWASVASKARLALSDGTDITYSSTYHTGGSSWEWMTVTRTDNATAIYLRAWLYVGPTTTAYFDGAMLNEGVAVSAFAPGQLQETNINTGTATITAGNGSVVVSHGLATTPTRVFVTMSSNPGVATSVYTTSVGATSFTIAVSTNVTNSTTFDWRAIVGEGN